MHRAPHTINARREYSGSGGVSEPTNESGPWESMGMQELLMLITPLFI